MKKLIIAVLLLYTVCFALSCRKKDSDDCPNCPKVDAITPASGKKGDTVLISGRNFSETLKDNIVTFNGTTVAPAAMISGSSTQLKVLVPPHCGTGSVEVKLDDELYSENGPIFTYNSETIVTVFAGSPSGTAGNTASGNSFTNTRFDGPTQVGVDALNNVFVMDVGNTKIVKLDAATGLNVVLSDNSSQITNPTALAVDEKNILYVSDYDLSNQNATIYKFTPGATTPVYYVEDFELQQKHVSIFSEGNAQFYIGRVSSKTSLYFPNIVHLTSKGFEPFTNERGHVVTYKNGTVYELYSINAMMLQQSKFTKFSVADTTEKVLIDENGGLNEPLGLVLDNAGNIYIADTNNNRILKYSTSGIISTLVSTGLNKPKGITIDKLGNIYVADSGNNNIKKITFD